MGTAQLIHSVVAVALMAAIGCSRAETNQKTEQAAAEVKTAAARAGDKIADGWLTTRIQAQYFADEQVKGRYIDVSTNDKVVTLKGYVESPAARERALQIARSTNGVRQVNDQLLIGQSPKAFEAAQADTSAQQPVATSGETPPGGVAVPVDDAQLTNNIQAKYFLDPTVKGRHIEVDTRGGVVTLNGEVASEGERAQALLLARSTQGVQRVEDHLTVNAGAEQQVSSGPATQPLTVPADDAKVATEVKTQFAADPQLQVIDVTVQEGVAQLQGTVPSTAVRQKAVDLARNTEGVTQVVDRLRIRK
jgi:hyperosmotically inducible protein